MTITRRTFLSLAGSTAIGAKAAYALQFAPDAPRFAYIAAKGSASGLYVFASRDPEWRLLHFVPGEEPVALTIHPHHRTLYVLHEVANYRTLPRGYVSVYRIDGRSSKPALLGVQPLSLSATCPRHFAISPDGKFLIASAQGGGAYNLFPIAEDGSMGRICGIRKEVGCGPLMHSQGSAHPQAVLFTRRSGCVLTVDQGNDTISILDADPSLRMRARSALPPATGAVSLAIHHGSQIAFVCGSLSQALLTFRFDAKTAGITQPVARIAEGVNGPLATHPILEILYAATPRGVAVYDFQRADTLRCVQHLDIEDGEFESQRLQFSPFFNALFICTRKGLLRMSADPVSGVLQAPRSICSVPHAQSVAFL
jgi:6-phosphogluconolactonase